jgi:hypothetical protein
LSDHHADLIPDQTHDNMQLMQVIAKTTAHWDEHGWLCVCYNTKEYNNTGEKKCRVVELSAVHNDSENTSDTYSLYASQSSPDRQDIHIPL